MADFRKLKVWWKGRMLAGDIYRITEHFPPEEKFNLAAQMQRASISVISNVAEGCGRQSGKEFARFLYIARGSLFELETQLYVAGDLGLIGKEKAEPLLAQAEEIGRMLAQLIKTVENRS